MSSRRDCLEVSSVIHIFMIHGIKSTKQSWINYRLTSHTRHPNLFYSDSQKTTNVSTLQLVCDNLIIVFKDMQHVSRMSTEALKVLKPGLTKSPPQIDHCSPITSLLSNSKSPDFFTFQTCSLQPQH